jgi:Na+/proline symporter
MSALSFIDWSIVALYLVLSLGMGFYMRTKAGESLESYFVAGRKMSGWLVGTSMVATTFAADTPLAVTGIIAKNGIAGNWFWWSLAFSHILAAFVFARLWRRAHIITDAEFIELRYSGRAATILRVLRAFFFAIPINCIIMGWVIRAMGKIVSVLFPWDMWLGPEIYGPLLDAWPSWIAVQSPSEAISIILGVIVATTYAAMGGLPSVIYTDVIQFLLAMVGSILLAYFAIEHVGGLGQLVSGLQATYGAEQASGILSFFPDSESAWLPLEMFLVYVLVQWWAQKFSDGGGILIQRMSAAKDENHALRGTSWFVVAHYALRPWPWILVGLVALVVFPLDGALLSGTHAQLATVQADREMAYPVLMAQLLPAGALGIMVTGMVAAFMSTIDTHITWGASYMVKDVYQRFIRPEATEAELVKTSRWAVLVMVLFALAVTTQIHTIEAAWKFITVMGSGIGLVSIARWFWWRINAEAEIAGLSSAAILSLLLYGPMKDYALEYQEKLLMVVVVSTAAVVITMLLTKPSSPEQLRKFYEVIRPSGFWGPVRRPEDPPAENLGKQIMSWGLAAISLFSILFGLGEWLLGSTPVGVALSLGGTGGWLLALHLVGAFKEVATDDLV